MKKNLFALFGLLCAFSHAPLALADTLSACDPSYPDATYQAYVSSSPTQQADIRQAISNAIQTEQASNATAFPELYGQLETSFTTSVTQLGTGQHDSQYANLVIQQLKKLGADGIGTRFITSDYQNAIAVWRAKEAAAASSTPDNYSGRLPWYDTEAAAITDAYNAAIVATLPTVNGACASQLQQLQKRIAVADSNCVAGKMYEGICLSHQEYCQRAYGTWASAGTDGACTAPCPTGQAFSANAGYCVPQPSPTIIPTPAVLPPSTATTLPPRVVPAPAQPSNAPIKAKPAPTARAQEAISTASTPTSTFATTASANPPQAGFWSWIIRVLNPFSWFR